MSPPCRFYNTPNGCKHGDRCSFSHNSRPSGSGPSNWRQAPQVLQRAPLPAAPRGVCNFYWSTGSCRREFDCRFEHTRNPSIASSSSLGPSPQSSGLGPGADRFSPSSESLSPNQLHSHLKKYLRDDLRFEKTFSVYGFVTLLGSLDTSGPRWAPEDGPLLLTSLATGNGLLRISDVFQWPCVSSHAAPSGPVLSFQKGYIPLLKFYSSECVVKSTLNHLVNGLYMRILDNFENWSKNLDQCMQDIMIARSFKDVHGVFDASLGSQVLSSLEVVFFEILTRFKNATATYQNLPEMVHNLQTWTETWIEGISMSPPAFDDPFEDTNSATRDQIVNHLRSKVRRLVTIVDREQGRVDRAKQRHATPTFGLSDRSQEGVIAALTITYEGPGKLRSDGPRHDNDFVDITDIRIAPTHDELTSCHSPFLPGNFHGAPHHLPPESMEHLLDVQFRLLREELTASLRISVHLVLEDLTRASPSSTLSKLIKNRGGKYRSHTDSQDQVMFNVYTNVTFATMIPDWRGLSVELSINTPPGKARQPQAKNRVAFWEGMSGKRLIQGGLVALVWQTGVAVDVHLGIIASSAKELTDSARNANGDERVSIRVVFFDPEVEVRILNALKNQDLAQTGIKILVEAPVMFEAIRPFLEALRVEPELVPFAEYLAHHRPGFLASKHINPPRYALAPDFTYQLESLFPPEAGIDDLKLDVSNPASIASARAQLRTSRLDESQGEAIIDTLTRELAMIQGPPGTGKSFTGVEILRVLLANNVRPILMIAFTNHALDHLLTSVLDAGIKNKVVRLGSRSADERISNFSLDNLEHSAGKSRLHNSFGHHYRELKSVQEEIKYLMKTLIKVNVTSEEFRAHLKVQYTEHYEHLYLYPPEWVVALFASREDGDDGDSHWMRAGKHRKVELEDNSMYAFWKNGEDLDFLESCRHLQAEYDDSRNNQNRFNALVDLEQESDSTSLDDEPDACAESEVEDGESSDEEDTEEESWQRDWHTADAEGSDHPVEAASAELTTNVISSYFSDVSSALVRAPISVQADPVDPRSQFGGQIPFTPDFNRSLDILLAEGTMWSFSRRERHRLHAYWSGVIRERLHEDRLKDFKSLKSKYENILKKNEESKNEIRRQLLKGVDIVGCTTTGAAKLTSLLKSLSPRVMLVEEAGQVLEAHILGSLVPSVEHLILIGDPSQLRPTLNNYALSMDNKRGKQLFKFDMSLMERLASNKLAMSQINVQRRMRPDISTLIRKALYPALQDHDLVKKYPNVRGFSKNVFFLDHSHRENDGEEESSSKYNTFEVRMIKDLVLHLLRQGCYSEEGDIVVLCAYLGQLARVRDALRSEVAIIIDGRDKEDLAEAEEELEDHDQGHIEHIQVTKRVRLRTVDNYQGEEASVVILSTVRNAGGGMGPTHGSGRPTIGFLASENRTNVALSRAKHGLFILGNAAQLASRSKMWRGVIDQLESTDCLGRAFPVSCHRHPETIQLISEPGKLPLFAPDGGCLEPCAYRLKCGHVCQYKCHPDDPKHIAVSCSQPCRRLCPRNHPCDKNCSENCGDCRFVVRDVELPCGHQAAAIKCHRLDNLDEVSCSVPVTKSLPNCEHLARVTCSTDVLDSKCSSICGEAMPCCGRPCKSKCHECQSVNGNAPGLIARIQHQEHLCQKLLFCAHTCSKPCSRDHQCATVCQNQCRQECSHSQCNAYCSTPCSPCMKDCTWVCPHKRCPLPCGSVCSRLPCDLPCPESLRCGHKCPSVCGEPCSIQICPSCASDSQKQNVVDLILCRKLEDVDPEEGALDDLLITLPKCRHVFTVETLDGHCGMSDFYTQSDDGKWLQLRSPETRGETRAPPVCPTCREAITSPRYGRVFKSADLDILERNVISAMVQKLDKLQTSMTGIMKSRIAEALKRESTNLALPSALRSSTKKEKTSRTKARRNALKSAKDLPVPLNTLLPKYETLHAVSPAIADAWQRATRSLTSVYAEAMKVAETRSAHIKAWEAAFSCLYEQEMNLAMADPAHAPRRPEEHAMRMARMKVGQPQPRADKRFVVEAFWETLKLRFIIADLAKTWMEELIGNVKNFSADERQKWGSFVLFVLDSCLRDSDLAYSMARASESRRQMTTSVLLMMRACQDRFRFNVDMSRASGNIQEDRRKHLEGVAQEIKNAEEMIDTTMREHTTMLPKDRQTWLPDNFSETARAILDEWKKLEKSIRTDKFYQAVSLDEKMTIVRALNFCKVAARSSSFMLNILGQHTRDTFIHALEAMCTLLQKLVSYLTHKSIAYRLSVRRCNGAFQLPRVWGAYWRRESCA
ncbi:hypothetical protein GGX14DRAFT_438313 [Mycena pura]|uniref:C3H1-type domain-containing protein n=1 Tax=Mycena pura TaxID=153505 RepID=A0AAD6VMW4_9AGAR|nr:hypothetical protein GGX14DRAFT_438313 [Mycena pura]